MRNAPLGVPLTPAAPPTYQNLSNLFRNHVPRARTTTRKCSKTVVVSAPGIERVADCGPLLMANQVPIDQPPCSCRCYATAIWSSALAGCCMLRSTCFRTPSPLENIEKTPLDSEMTASLALTWGSRPALKVESRLASLGMGDVIRGGLEPRLIRSKWLRSFICLYVNPPHAAP